jgi:hypothetical protein
MTTIFLGFSLQLFAKLTYSRPDSLSFLAVASQNRPILIKIGASSDQIFDSILINVLGCPQASQPK